MSDQGRLGSGSDVVDFLRAQHARIKELFEKTLAADGSRREESFRTLRQLMAIHETTEQELVHPVASRELPGGEAIIATRLEEEKTAKTLLTHLETLATGSKEFEAGLRKLQSAVLAHAEREEQDEFAKLVEFDRLITALDGKRLQRMRKAAELADLPAATRPHLGVESAAAKAKARPFSAMVEQARDALNESGGR